MKIKLIPILEIYRSVENIKAPEFGPYWEYQDEWEKYNNKSLVTNGFSNMESYLKGSNFYRISDINDHDLLLQIKYRVEGWELDEICPFDGGYILNVNGEDLLFPQCCSDLGDIESWIALANGENRGFWQGHPWPVITVDKGKIIFDLSVDEFDERFVPIPLKEKFEIDKLALKDAVDNLMIEMKQFAERLNAINIKENLGFEKLDKILIGKIE